MSSHFVRLRYTLSLLLIALCASGIASADQTVYVAGHVGASIGHGRISGMTGSTPSISFDDEDRDSSLVVSGSVGLTVPMDELLGWALADWMEVPDWPVRSDVQILGLRSFDYETLAPAGSDARWSTASSSWAIMFNNYFDVPATILTRPLASAFGARETNIRRILEPITVYAAIGTGSARLTTEAANGTGDRVSRADWKFAWQTGAGVGYELRRSLHLDLGYRYFKVSDIESQTLDSNGNLQEGSSFRFSERIHEFRAGIRIDVYSFTVPWAKHE